MKKIIIVATIFLFTCSCVGVVTRPEKTNETPSFPSLHDECEAGLCWLWYDGYDNLDECVKDWNEREKAAISVR